MPSTPVIGDGMVSTTVPAERANARSDFIDRQLVRFGIADNPPFADVLTAGLELRFDQNHRFDERWRRGQHRQEARASLR